MQQREDLGSLAIFEWFAERGFGLLFTDQADVVWVALTRATDGEVVAPMYGRGITRVAAAESAKERYEEEQG